MNYPKRGEMSEDGKYYTHTDGSVHEVTDTNCQACSAFTHDFCKTLRVCTSGWQVVEGAHVPSAEEQEACDMARAMIYRCSCYRYELLHGCDAKPCNSCSLFTSKSCPARAYLASHGDANAWEVTT